MVFKGGLATFTLSVVICCCSYAGHTASGFISRAPTKASIGGWRQPSRPITTFDHQTHLNAFFRRLFRRGKRCEPSRRDDILETNEASSKAAKVPSERRQRKQSGQEREEATICVIGGGVSGLAAAYTAAKELSERNDTRVILLESSSSIGGRVQSDVTNDGYVLDRGFAVFIEEYPLAKELLDYDALKLGKFLPGALVKVEGQKELARVVDPLRQPTEIIGAIFAPIGTLGDKLALLPLLFNVMSKSITELFEERETDTLSVLRNGWGFSDNIIERFFKPFLEGIYLAPLEEQSSRLFAFVFKMFSEGYAALPEGGIGAVATQLADKARSAGAEIILGNSVAGIQLNNEGFILTCEGGKTQVHCQSVVVATDGAIAQKLVSQIPGFQSLSSLPEQPQRSVSCLYYAFDTKVPVDIPILILNGVGEERGSISSPVNNMCFPSVVNSCYAPEGCSLASVTLLSDTMAAFKGREDEIDLAVRRQISTWFPDHETEIMEKWVLKGSYSISKAQPGQLDGPWPANVNGGRPSNIYRGKQLPSRLYICGDHMATATLNGALESGVNAGRAAAKACGQVQAKQVVVKT